MNKHRNATLSELVQDLPVGSAEALPVGLAQQVIARFIDPIQDKETLPLRQALGRVLADDVISPIDVPAHDNSAMDGYALRGADLAAGGAVTLTIIGRAMAGTPYHGAVGPGQCVRIMTGAVMPADCDTVVPQEFTRSDAADQVTLAADIVKPGENRRLQGEDLAQGKVALARGRLLRPAELGLLASLGIATISLQRRLRVVFFSTGDEICSLGEALAEGGVYDSNRYTIYGMLTRLGCETIDLGVVRDDPDALAAALNSACELGADAIITSGGVSVGDADYIRPLMLQMGDMAFWKLLMRPGRPMAFGRLRAAGHQPYLFGLPGNPVAVMVSFYFFVRSALLHLMGADVAPLPLMRARSQAAIRKKPGRTEYQRGILSIDAGGLPVVALTGAQGAGILRSMAEANCFVVLPHASGSVNAGDEVEVLLFEGLV